MNPGGPRPTMPMANPIPRLPIKPPDTGVLNAWDAAAIIVCIVIGTTIFKSPPLIFGAAGGPWGGLLVWIAGGVLALIGALCYAELATSFPRSGGDYVYLTRAFGPLTGFLFGWTQLTIVLTCSIGAMAVVFGEYATKLYDLKALELPIELPSMILYAIAAIVVLTLLNFVGVVVGKWAQNLLSLLKIGGVIAIIVAGLGWPQSNPFDGAQWPNSTVDHWTWGSLSIILVMYAYGGWNDAAFVAAEVRDPKRNIPRALIYGVGVIMILYILVNLAYLVGLGYDDAKKFGELPPLKVLNRAFGAESAKILSVVIMVSALGAVNSLIFAGARVYAVLGNDHGLFGWMGHWKPGRRSPFLALTVQAVIALSVIIAFGTSFGHGLVDSALEAVSAASNWVVGFLPGKWEEIDVGMEKNWVAGKAFENLFGISAPFFWVFFLMTGFSLFALRDQKPANQRPFSVPLYPFLPFAFCCMCIYMIYKSVLYVQTPRAQFGLGMTPVLIVFVVIVLLGVPLYFISRSIGYHEGGDDE